MACIACSRAAPDQDSHGWDADTIVAMAKQLGVSAVWCQSGLASAATKAPKGCWVSRQESQQARAIAESAGLHYVDDVYIVDVARLLATKARRVASA